jgi:hypothetical protein
MVFQSGTYTPTVTPTANVTSYTALPAHWERTGDAVHVSGRINIQPTSKSGLPVTSVRMTLPVMS